MIGVSLRCVKAFFRNYPYLRSRHFSMFGSGFPGAQTDGPPSLFTCASLRDRQSRTDAYAADSVRVRLGVSVVADGEDSVAAKQSR